MTDGLLDRNITAAAKDRSMDKLAEIRACVESGAATTHEEWLFQKVTELEQERDILKGDFKTLELSLQRSNNLIHDLREEKLALESQLRTAREALECARYGLKNPASDQKFALNAIEQALASLSPVPITTKCDGFCRCGRECALLQAHEGQCECVSEALTQPEQEKLKWTEEDAMGEGNL